MSSLQICTQGKGLIKGSGIYVSLVQLREVLGEYSPTLGIIYAKCYGLVKVKELLGMYKSSNNVVTWIALIISYDREGHNQNALDYFEPNAM